MPLITDFTSLVQSIKDMAEDDGAEFSNYIPTAIALAEERLFRELDLSELETKAVGTLSPNQPVIAKPAGYEFSEYFSVGTGSAHTILKKRTNSYIKDYWPNQGVVGKPKYYCDESASTFTIVPTPDSNYTYEIRFTAKPPKLSSVNLTNYYTLHAVDVLFAACMVEMTKFMKAWDQTAVFEQAYVTARDTYNIQSMRYRRDGGETPMNNLGGKNTLKHTINTGA